MSACPSHADLIGPYVLGALEPAEMEEMRRHLAACPRCAAEARSLAGLPALLDRVQMDEPVPVPSPGLEDAVLDRFVRERASAGPPPRRRRRRRHRRLAVALAGAAAAALVALAPVLALPGGSEEAYARAELWSMPAGGAAGTAEVAEVEAGTSVELRARRLAKGEYELWCVREDGRWISGGTFQARSDGTASAELSAAVRPGDYHVMVVTRRTAEGVRGTEVMRGKLIY
jgi:anti-sigma factor RsiW